MTDPNDSEQGDAEDHRTASLDRAPDRAPTASPVPAQSNVVLPNKLEALIKGKISELERDREGSEQENEEIARAVRAENKKLTTLVNETDTEIGKVTLLQRKYTMLFQDMQRLERDHARERTKADKTLKERDTAKTELGKAVGMKQKLETLCRELQKENKRVKEDSRKLQEAEQQKRVELNNKFETTIFEIKNKLDEESGAHGRRSMQDEELKDKFKSFLEQYELRETHYHQTLRAKELEIRLYQARSEQHRKAADVEAQRAKTLRNQVTTFSETEAELRSQLTIYVEKFKQVEDTLNNSNDLFLNFRKEMETMTKKTKKLEKENALIRGKCDTANRNILEMAEERAKFKKEMEALKLKSTKLESLCRALQSERAKTNAVLNANAAAAAATAPSNGVVEARAQSEDENGDDEGQLSCYSSEGEEDYDSLEEREEIHSLPPLPMAPDNKSAIMGYLKVSAEEEALIRQKRKEYKHDLRGLPDKDQDGFLAVSTLEREYINAFRDSKIVENGLERLMESPLKDSPEVRDITAKFDSFKKMFTSMGGMPGAKSLIEGGSFDDMTPAEQKLYKEASARLATMTQQYGKEISASLQQGVNGKGDMRSVELKLESLPASLMEDARKIADMYAQSAYPQKFRMDFAEAYAHTTMRQEAEGPSTETADFKPLKRVHDHASSAPEEHDLD